MDMTGKVCGVEHGVIEGSAWAIVWVSEGEDRAPQRIGVIADIVGEARALKFGQSVALDVEMSTFQGRSKLRAREIKPGAVGKAA